MGAGPYTVPILITNVSQLGSLTLTVTYNPAVLRAQTATLGQVMQQGGVTPAFSPKIDEATGRIDLVISRSGDPMGVSVPSGAQGLLASIVFETVAPGASPISLAGVGMTMNGQALSLNFVSANVTVK